MESFFGLNPSSSSLKAALGHVDVVQTLKGSQRLMMATVNHKGENTLHLAARFGSLDMLQALTEGPSPKKLQEILTAKTKDRDLTPIQVARLYNHHEFADTLEQMLRQLLTSGRLHRPKLK